MTFLRRILAWLDHGSETCDHCGTPMQGKSYGNRLCSARCADRAEELARFQP